jgi:hypothetical protein
MFDESLFGLGNKSVGVRIKVVLRDINYTLSNSTGKFHDIFANLVFQNSCFKSKPAGFAHI